VDAAVLEKGIVYPNRDTVWAPLQPMLTSMITGGVGGPIMLRDGWMVFRIKSKVQQAQPFESMPPELRSVMQERAAEIKRDEVLKKHTDHYRAMYKPEIHPERLKKIAWPIEGMAAAAPQGMPGVQIN